MSKKRQILFLIPVFLFCFALIFIVLKGIFAREEKNMALSVSNPENQTFLLINQAGVYTKGYRQMMSLGWPPAEISLGDSKEGDMEATHKLVPRMIIPEQITNFINNKWQLGEGLFLSDTSMGAKEKIIYLPHILLSICQRLNSQLWQDAADQKPMTLKADFAAWRAGTADARELFSGQSRAEACVLTSDNIAIYYKTVWSNKTGMSTPPPPRIAPPPPLPKGADPELAR